MLKLSKSHCMCFMVIDHLRKETELRKNLVHKEALLVSYKNIFLFKRPKTNTEMLRFDKVEPVGIHPICLMYHHFEILSRG